MRHYISDGRRLYEDENHGLFSKKLAEWAIGRMEVRDKATGELKRIIPRTMSEVTEALKAIDADLPEAMEYTALYLFNMAVADYPKTCEDDKRRALFVAETLTDPDGCPESVLDCFEAKMAREGTPIYWERYL